MAQDNVVGFQEAPEDPESDRPQDQEAAIRMLANSLHRLNEAVVKAVEAGLTVEFVRASRYHNGSGNWGDQMTPIIKQKM
jgi:hypothetical protein